MSSPLHKKYTPAEFDESERIGLTSDQAEELYKQWGYNELPEVTVSLWWVLFVQFTGTMPYMLELAAVIAIAVQDYTDFAIILAMLLANGFLGFHEQLKAAESLVSFIAAYCNVCMLKCFQSCFCFATLAMPVGAETST